MINRDGYLNKIKPYIDTELIKVIVGVRRSGKSVFLKLIQNYLFSLGVDVSQVVSINFEELANEDLLDYHKLNQYLEDKIKNNTLKTYIFLDEIQEVDLFEKVINSIRATYSDKVDIYITGSNAKLLSSEISTLLAGRYIQIEMYPFNFSEYVGAKKDLGIQKSHDELFMEYTMEGGIPFLASHDFSISDSNRYLEDIYNSIILKDIISREKVRDVDILQKLIKFIFSNIGRPFSANSIVKYLKSESVNISVPTVLNYLSFAENAYAIRSVKAYDIQGKKHLRSQSKYYVFDHGLKQAIVGRNDNDIEQVLGNIVFNELMVRDYSVSVGKTGNYEVDFIAQRIVEKEKEIVYIQVCYLMASEDMRNREFRALEEINDNYEKIVLSLDQITSDRNGIKHRNIVDWLLGKER